jgi:molybdopterin molybdotransferase
MLSTTEAAAAIAAAMPSFDTETVPLGGAAGRVLRQAVAAERDQPPFDRVTMDGIAIAFEAVERGVRRFGIQATQHAGDPASELLDASRCVEVMTGTVLPGGCDCVVPIERVNVADGMAMLADDYRPERRQFVHTRGSDHRQGTEVLSPGIVIAPMDVAIIASCGLAKAIVSCRPVVRVLSTGNELVAAGAPIEPHQIRLSNGPAVQAMLARQGFDDCLGEHLPDDPGILRQRIAAHLEAADVLLLSGGVSMGKADFVPAVLGELGVQVVFHKISQRPGKPMWFGIGPGGEAVFALPGNPVSTLVCCRQYVLPALFAASGRAPRAGEWAALTEDVTFRPDLTCFLPVRIASDVDGLTRAHPVPTNTSGDFTSLAGTDGYIELARDQCFFPRGAPVPLHRWAAP